MIRIILAVSVLLGSIYAAHAYNFGRLGVTFSRLGAAGKSGTGSGPPPTCTINGSLNFSGSSSCNMIFYMTGVIQ